MRALKLKDGFKIARILNKMKFNEWEFSPEGTQEEVGAQMMKYFIEHLPDAEEEVMELIASITEKPADEIELSEIPEIFSEIMKVKGIENFSQKATMRYTQSPLSTV